MIIDGVLAPLELAHLPYRKGRTFEDYVGQRGLDRLGRLKWRRHVGVVIEKLRLALETDYVVLGGGNTRFLDSKLPEGVRLGSNSNAFLGARGFGLTRRVGAYGSTSRSKRSLIAASGDSQSPL